MEKIRMMLAGYSISLDYGKTLAAFLPERFTMLDRKGVDEAYKNLDEPLGGNAGDSRRMLGLVRELCAKPNFDLFVFNCGLHDVKLNAPERVCQVPLDEYRSNLREIIRLLKNNGVRAVFVTTTPADRSRYSENAGFWRRNEDVIDYNRAALEIMNEAGVGVIDLYSFTVATGLVGDALFRDHTHFTPEVIGLHAAFIAGALSELK